VACSTFAVIPDIPISAGHVIST